jgi:zinc protease
MTVQRAGELAQQYLDADRMIWLVVGDARTQRGRLQALGLGAPIPVDREGRRITEPRGRPVAGAPR